MNEIMIKVTDKSGKLRGYLTSAQFKAWFNIPASTQRFLSDLLKEYSHKDSEVNFEMVLKSEIKK